MRFSYDDRIMRGGMRVSARASQLSVDSAEDYSSNNGNEMRPAAAADSSAESSDVSLRSCNSNATLKQWTTRLAVTTSAPSSQRQQRTPRRRRRDDDDGNEQRQEEAVCQRPDCRPRKPCTLVAILLLLGGFLCPRPHRVGEIMRLSVCLPGTGSG